MSSKLVIKRGQESDDGSDGEENLLSQALPVAQIKDVDLSVPPASGEEYLYRVRLEASKNKVMIAKNLNLKKFDLNRTAQYFQPEVVDQIGDEFKPPLSWQYEVSADLRDLRDRVQKEKKTFLANNPKVKLEFPPLKNKSEWYTFCFGSRVEDGQVDKEVDQGNEPRLTLLYKMDQNTIVHLLDYHIIWLEKFGCSRRSFEWIYALFCFVEKPLLPETHSSLRDLARMCKSYRSKLTRHDDESLTPLNLLISLISRYFDQNDLADN